MRLAESGDLVLSYASGEIGRIGMVADAAIVAPKPSEFGQVGAYWNEVGWLLPIEWFDRPIRVKPKSIITSLMPHLPQTHSPIRAATGDGNQKAYLAEVKREIFDEILGAINTSVADFNQFRPSARSRDFVEEIENHIERDLNADPGLDATVRLQILKSRRGQGVFRKRVLDNGSICRVTGVSDPLLLIASHIKPWRACGTAFERLDGYNGLMLAPHADFLFDDGLLTFSNEGRISFSKHISIENLEKLGLDKVHLVGNRPFNRRSISYLEYHRTKVFKD